MGTLRIEFTEEAVEKAGTSGLFRVKRNREFIAREENGKIVLKLDDIDFFDPTRKLPDLRSNETVLVEYRGEYESGFRKDGQYIFGRAIASVSTITYDGATRQRIRIASVELYEVKMMYRDIRLAEIEPKFDLSKTLDEIAAEQKEKENKNGEEYP